MHIAIIAAPDMGTASREDKLIGGEPLKASNTPPSANETDRRRAERGAPYRWAYMEGQAPADQ